MTIRWKQLSPIQRNALVAEHIFARKVVQWQPGCYLLERIGLPGQHESIPAYSESMDAAWEIVEKLYEQFNVRIYAESGFLSKYNVMAYDKDYCRCQAHGYSDISMQDAICKAALKAHGLELDVS